MNQKYILQALRANGRIGVAKGSSLEKKVQAIPGVKKVSDVGNLVYYAADDSTKCVTAGGELV